MLTQRSYFADAVEALHSVGEAERASRIDAMVRTLELTDFRVVIFGEFNRGKSTLINALLGREALPAMLVPTTGHVTRIRWGQRDEVRVTHATGLVERRALEELGTFSTLSRHGEAREGITSLEVSVNAPLLSAGLVLIDTPGVGDPNRAQTVRAQEALHQADLVLLLLDARQLLSERERRFVSETLVGGLGKPVVPVLNFLNLVDDHEGDEQRRRLDSWCRSTLPAALQRPWYEVNAFGALKAAIGLGPAPRDDFAALRNELQGLVGAVRHRLQMRSRIGHLRAEIESTRRSNAEILQSLRIDAEAVDRRRSDAIAALVTASNRFDVMARTQRDAVVTSASSRLLTALDDLKRQEIQGKGKQALEQGLASGYQKHLFAAIDRIEREADSALASLTAEGLDRPGPMTIRERFLLDARIEVGILPTIAADGKVVGWAAVVGGVIGTAFLPGMGTVAGAGLGAWVANKLGSKEADYAAAYIEKVNEKWPSSSLQVLRLLIAQFDARVAEMKQGLDDRLAVVRSAWAGAARDEIDNRREADEALARCLSELRRLVA